MTTARIPKTSRRGRGRQPGEKMIPWDLNPDILSRMEEHQRLREAGLSAKQIIVMQQIDAGTYYNDEKRLHELAARLLGRSQIAHFQAMVQAHYSTIRDSHRLFEDPAQDGTAKVGALDKRIKAADKISMLYRFYQPRSDHPGAPAQAAADGSAPTIQNNQTNVIVTNPNEMLEMLERRAAELYSEMNAIPSMAVDEARKLYGHDNIIPVGQRIKAGTEEEGDDEDDEE